MRKRLAASLAALFLLTSLSAASAYGRVLDRESNILYASEDGGGTWKDLGATVLYPQAAEGQAELQEVRAAYGFAWTGEGYISCRRVVEGRYGMMGMSGGNWYDPYSTQVCLLDAEFGLLSAYDFGRQVKSVGYCGGKYYAEVSDCAGVSAREYADYTSSTLYTSSDGQAWEKTEIMQIVQSLNGLS